MGSVRLRCGIEPARGEVAGLLGCGLKRYIVRVVDCCNDICA